MAALFLQAPRGKELESDLLEDHNMGLSLMPRCIRATTQKGFCMKIFFFILSYTIMRTAPTLV
jgi:hypothetical protein